MQSPNRDGKMTALSAVPTMRARRKTFTLGNFTAVRSGARSVKEGKEWKNTRYFDW